MVVISDDFRLSRSSKTPSQKTLLVNNEMIYVGITNHYIHDVFDETMFYEFLES